MAADDIAQLADALSKTHVGDGELSYQGRGLKLDNAESGGTWPHSQHVLDLVLMASVYRHFIMLSVTLMDVLVCLVFSGGFGI